MPFLGESIETAFNFSTRENPFRLQVALFAGGGFFGITITPDRVRILEAALEFGAAVSVDFGVASGSVSVMAGIYFRLETDAAGKENAQLTGYFRMRGEVEALGLVSVCIELYLSLTYETKTEKAVGRATLTVEVEVAFFSVSVEISCEKKFSGKDGRPVVRRRDGPARGGQRSPLGPLRAGVRGGLMASESAILTALPNGVDENGEFLRVTVFVTPRLSTGGPDQVPLGDFPAFADWPATLAQTVFGIEFDGVATFDTQPDPTSGVARLRDVAPALRRDQRGRGRVHRPFGPHRAVVPRRGDLGLRARHSTRRWRSPHRRSSRRSRPARSRELGDVLGSLGEHKHRYYGRLDERDREGRPGGTSTGAVTGYRTTCGSRSPRPTASTTVPASATPPARTTSRRGPSRRTSTSTRSSRSAATTRSCCASSASRWTCVVRLRRRRSGPRGRMRVVARGPEPWLEAEGARPWTRYELEGELFVAEPREREADLVDGMLRLEHKRLFVVNQLDVDGSVLKTVDFAGNLQRVNDHLRAARALDDRGRVVAAGAAKRVGSRSRATRARRRSSAGSTRPRGTSRLASAGTPGRALRRGRQPRLPARRRGPASSRAGGARCTSAPGATPSRDDELLPIPPDEGYVKGASASSVPGDKDLYLHETLVGWDGWSLAAKRPGRVITDDGHRGDRARERDRLPADHAVRGDARHAAAPAVRPRVPVPRAGGRPRRQLRARPGDRPAARHRAPRLPALRAGAVAGGRPAPPVHARASRCCGW